MSQAGRALRVALPLPPVLGGAPPALDLGLASRVITLGQRSAWPAATAAVSSP